MTKETFYLFGKPIEVDTRPIEEIEPYASFIVKAPSIYQEAKKESDDWLIMCASEYLSRLEKIPFDESRKDEVDYLKEFFEDYFEFYLAGLLLKDGALPLAACKAYVESIEYASSFLIEKKIACPDLYLFPKKRGRKENINNKIERMKGVHESLFDGRSITESYQAVAKKYFVSVDTIRRDFERWGNKLCFENGVVFTKSGVRTYRRNNE